MLPEGLPQVELAANQHERLQNDLLAFIRHAVQKRPWFIVLEDLQWSDAPSLEFLALLGHNLPEWPMLILGTYRDTDLDPNHSLSEILRNLGQYPGYRVIALERLSLNDVETQLRHIWHLELPRNLVEKIYAHTTGNPLYVDEIIKTLMDEGHIILRDGVWHFPDPDKITLPPGIRETVLRRVNLLPQDAQTLLRQAAILGPSFSFRDLQALTHIDDWELLEQLDLLFERQFLEEVKGEERLRFRHPEVQQTLYEDLGPLRRRILHRQAGEVLEQHTDIPPEVLAQHFIQAEEYAKAITYSLLAAYNAEQTYAHATALHWYRQALDQLLRMEAPERTALNDVHLTILRSLARLLLAEGNDQEALEYFTLARTLLNTMPPLATRQFQQADICQQVAQIYEQRNDYTTAWTWIERGLNYIRDQAPTQELVQIYHRAGWIALRQESYPQAEQMFEHTLGLARQFGLVHMEADNIRALGIVAWYTNRDAQAADLFQQALMLYQSIGDKQGEAYCLNNLGIVANYKNHHEEARSFYNRALTLYHQIGNQAGASGTLHNLALVLRNEGQFEAALEQAEQALALRRQLRNRRGEASTLDVLGSIHLLLGDYALAEDLLKKALALHEDVGNHAEEVETLNDLAWALLRSQRLPEAVTHLQRALRLGEKLSNPYHFVSALLHLGRLQLVQQAYRAAQTTFQHALTYRDRIRMVNLPLVAYAGLGFIALEQGNLEEVRRYAGLMLEHLESHIVNSIDEPYQLYHTLYRMLRALDDPRAEMIRATAQERRAREAQAITDATRRARYLAQADQRWLDETSE